MMNLVLKLEEYANLALPTDYDITSVMDDVIMAEFVDCNEDGELIQRGGIFMNINIQQNCWRVAKVIMVGPTVKDQINIGDHIMFPNDKGIKAVKFNSQCKRPVVFICASRIFCICKPKESAEAFLNIPQENNLNITNKAKGKHIKGKNGD
jgi:hypothetical protein